MTIQEMYKELEEQTEEDNIDLYDDCYIVEIDYTIQEQYSIVKLACASSGLAQGQFLDWHSASSALDPSLASLQDRDRRGQSQGGCGRFERWHSIGRKGADPVPIMIKSTTFT